jgi:hypothetical protein
MSKNERIFGASLSIKQCQNFGIKDADVIQAAMNDLNIKHFRLMSYWDEHEQKQGNYDFSILDKQIQLISKNNGKITLCIGARQPRWPESHWPAWTKKLPRQERNNTLSSYIQKVVERYRDQPSIISWQLENEALLKTFGENGDFDRQRLRKEYQLVKQLDSNRPIIMTTSTSWGIPFRRPTPDIYGFSYYRITHDKGEYRTSIYQPWVFKLRAHIIRFIKLRRCFIHELQAEPWGPSNIWEMDESEQAKSMNADILQSNIHAAAKTNLFPIYFWGLEWWYWRKQQGNPDAWNLIKKTLDSSKG